MTFFKLQGARRRERGNTLVEFSLVLPALMVLVLTVCDAGLYVAAFTAVQNASRSAVLRNSGGQESAVDQASACSVAADQLRGFPGVVTGTACTSSPLTVTSSYCAGNTACGTRSSSADGAPSALVTVRYTLPGVFRIPLTKLHTITAVSEMKIRSYQ